MFQVDLKNRKPLYEQVVDNYRYRILEGEVLKDSKVPSIREAAKTLGINPNTVQKAYRELESRGYFYTVLGQGTFIASPPENARREIIEVLYRGMTKIVQELVYHGESYENIITRIQLPTQAESNERSGNNG